MPLIAILGWPAVIASILTTGLAITRRSPALALVGTVLAVPFLLYLSASANRLFYLPVLVGACHFAAAWSIHRGRPWLATVLVLPFVALTVIVAWAVLTQPK